MEKSRIEIIVSGRVQGVFFRAFTARVARSLGICGWVRNERDGSVKIVAEGERSVLLSFLEKIKKGPPLAKIRSLEVGRTETKGEFSGFEVKS